MERCVRTRRFSAAATRDPGALGRWCWSRRVEFVQTVASDSFNFLTQGKITKSDDILSFSIFRGVFAGSERDRSQDECFCEAPLEASFNMTTLKDKTLFITGASRGIGLAIALRAARDGANVAVAAKTVAPNPKLPGTIYTAAEAIEAAGGRALALELDIRDEGKVQEAVEPLPNALAELTSW